jgi:tRNA-specific 2-thiouridylase
MSGGTDSSAAALLLSEQNYDVVGVTLKLWEYEDDGGKGKCCTPEDVRDARQVAFALDIPFYVRDYSDEFSNDVVDYFTDEYLRGRTPNPCVVCNDKIKFHYLDLLCQDAGADFVATGHYARLVRDQDNGEMQLWRGKDKTRDQSYFLYRLSQRHLQKLMFPLGELEKSEIRALLLQRGMNTANKAESREICFVENKRYAEFIEKRSKQKIAGGSIVTTDGESLGTHEGIHAYTVGQRKGLGIAAKEPLYVTKIDAEKNRVIVGSKHQAFRSGCDVQDVRWIQSKDQNIKNLQVQLRYRGSAVDATIEQVNDNNYRVEFVDGNQVPTPGQAAVFYDGERTLGGGFIK